MKERNTGKFKLLFCSWKTQHDLMTCVKGMKNCGHSFSPEDTFLPVLFPNILLKDASCLRIFKKNILRCIITLIKRFVFE